VRVGYFVSLTVFFSPSEDPTHMFPRFGLLLIMLNFSVFYLFFFFFESPSPVAIPEGLLPAR